MTRQKKSIMTSTGIIDLNGRWACHAERLFDGETVRDGLAVLIEGETIIDLLPVGELPRHIPLLAAPGCTVLPGLIDMHTHFMRWEGPLYLAYGVTTIRDVANPLDWILARRAEAWREPWPRIFCTGPALDGPVPHWPEIAWACLDQADARNKVQALADAGVDGIKLYVKLPGEWVAGMVDTAHAAGLPVMKHSTSGVLEPARAGIDEFFHLDGLFTDIWPDCPHGGWLDIWGCDGFEDTLPRQRQVADEIVRLGLITTPTLTVWDWFRRSLFCEQPLPEDAPYIPCTLVEWFTHDTTDPAKGARWARAIEHAQQFLGLLIERGAPILPGTDVPWTYHLPGHMLWRELAFLAAAGMTPLDTLRAVTARSAAALHAGRLGRLAPGYLADLVIVTGDPTREIPARPQISRVVKGGRVYAPAELLSIAEQTDYDIETEPLGKAFKRYFVTEAVG